MDGEGRAKCIIGLLESGYFDEKRPGVDVYYEKEGVDIKRSCTLFMGCLCHHKLH